MKQTKSNFLLPVWLAIKTNRFTLTHNEKATP
ncbi:MAG: hypothetical protein ACK5MZ_11505 [Aestuariibaculum sp.]